MAGGGGRPLDRLPPLGGIALSKRRSRWGETRDSSARQFIFLPMILHSWTNTVIKDSGVESQCHGM